MMKLNKIDGVEFLTFPHFENLGFIKHMFSTRNGGVSGGNFASLNLGVDKGDDPVYVRENFNRICRVTGMDIGGLVLSDQVHGTALHHVTEDDLGYAFTQPKRLRDIDGLLTNKPGVVLTTFYADCVSLFFVDPVRKVVALSHAGWRGTVNNIAGKTVKEMNHVYGSQAKDILAGIGPSIGPCCFEVEEPVALEFQEKCPQFAKYIETKPKGKYNIDLWRINAGLMVEAGIPETQVEISGICTKCNPSLFYSHRIMGFQRGSMAAMIAISDTKEQFHV